MLSFRTRFNESGSDQKVYGLAGRLHGIGWIRMLLGPQSEHLGIALRSHPVWIRSGPDPVKMAGSGLGRIGLRFFSKVRQNNCQFEVP